MMMFSSFKVKIKGKSLTADVKGEKLDPKKHHLKIEVKAATYSQLKIEKGKEYKAQCVVDV
ncbi:archease [Patescibacteria group bacterium]|nr:archease [Patescibacteria group bacterium]